MKEKYLKLTDAIYKVIEFFPEEEPLKNKIKERALEIIAHLILLSHLSSKNPGINQKEKISNQLLKDIEILKGYLKLGKSQGWIDSINFFILIKEYDRIKKEFQTPSVGRSEEQTPKKQREPVRETSAISERQKKILETLEKQGKAQVSDFKKIFPGLSKRTLRRDLEGLLKKKRVIRKGEWNQIFYKLKG